MALGLLHAAGLPGAKGMSAPAARAWDPAIAAAAASPIDRHPEIRHDIPLQQSRPMRRCKSLFRLANQPAIAVAN